MKKNRHLINGIFIPSLAKSKMHKILIRMTYYLQVKDNKILPYNLSLWIRYYRTERLVRTFHFNLTS